MRHILEKLQQHRDLTRGEMITVMTLIVTGRAPEDEMRDFLVFLNEKGFTVEEITGAVEVMRKFVVPVKGNALRIFDIVGTGGDGKHTLNVSTISAFVVAACGVTVAKHGNRSVSSRCGSADVLEALGVNITLPHERLAECLQKTGIAFLFAQAHHPAMKHVALVRKALGVKTLFNVLGPLTNPAAATHQMIGVYSRHLCEQMAHVLRNLGSRRALVAHGDDGLDEITTTGVTYISELKDGDVVSYEMTPEQFGLARVREADLKGGDVQENVRIVNDILSGKTGPHRDIVLLNSAFALFTAEQVADPRDGLLLAAQMIDSGKAWAKLEALKEMTNRVQ